MSGEVVLDAQLCFPLYAASRAFTRVYTVALAPLGLTYPQYLVLMVLWEEREVPMRDLGERLALDSGTLTPVLKRLEERGLLTRTRDADDERRVRVRVTREGMALERHAPAVSEQVRVACGLTDDQIGVLKELLGVAIDALGEQSTVD